MASSPFFSFLFAFIFLLINFLPSSSQNLTSFSFSDSPWLPTSTKLLLSPNSTFAAGFLPSPTSPTSQNLYSFSVWYNNLPGGSRTRTVVWSASTANASLSVTSSGQLVLRSGSSTANLFPGSNSSNSSRLILGDDGNLAFGDSTSFQHPTDTFLPGQSFNGTSLRSRNGKFSFLNSDSLFFNSSESYGTIDSAIGELNLDGTLPKANGAKIYVADFGANRTRRVKLDDDGNLRVYSFDPVENRWFIAWQAIQELCKVKGLCGENAICVSDGSDSTSCVCPPGFEQGRSESCARKIPVRGSGFKFLQLDYVNFSSGGDWNGSFLTATNFDVCRRNCSDRVNCLGFLFKYDGTGYCYLHFDVLKHGIWSPATDGAMFLKVASSETDVSNFTGMTSLLETTCPVRISLPSPPDQSTSTARNIAIIATLFAAELISGAAFLWIFLKKFIRYRDMARTLGLELLPAGGPKRFTYSELKSATNDFSNAIGRGGFGDVYRGELPDKRVVAVKCLKPVAGGDSEFWAEVTIIARMHHLNLVRLWGFCAEKGQRILVYEYVPNGSLDRYLFPAGRTSSSLDVEPDLTGPAAIDGKKPMLDWSIRYRIALGIARAMAYLHEECLEWVLHCDIKPENILLGEDFCPKIADFGLAKLRKKEDMVSMSRIRGTRGYMAPEWVKSDPITSKADVYSFGMVLLEIVTGSRNFEMQGSLMDSEDWYFPRWAFDKVFKERKVEDILDRQVKHCYDGKVHFEMVDRMVKTAMWCLQDRPEMRPSMGKVSKMLEGTVEITEPTKPTIFFLQE
ncbi:G-type lectin S-receptor-like serine/threonine-protein kinase At1g34300 [Linum grandiflorum]